MKYKTKNCNVFIIVLLIVNLQLGLSLTIAQETKKEKCDKIYECLQTFYSECYDGKSWDMLAPKLVENFTSAINHEGEMSRLDMYFSELQNNPQAMGYVVAYGGRTNKFGEYDIRVGRIKNYINFRSFDQSRIKFVNGGFREKFEFELWTSDIKNAFPPLTPTIAPEKAKFRGKMKLVRDEL